MLTRLGERGGGAPPTFAADAAVEAVADAGRRTGRVGDLGCGLPDKETDFLVAGTVPVGGGGRDLLAFGIAAFVDDVIGFFAGTLEESAGPGLLIPPSGIGCLGDDVFTSGCLGEETFDSCWAGDFGVLGVRGDLLTSADGVARLGFEGFSAFGFVRIGNGRGVVVVGPVGLEDFAADVPSVLVDLPLL